MKTTSPVLSAMTLIGVLCFTLTACGGNESKQDQAFDAYLKFKRITPKDEAHREVIYKEFNERAELANKIEEQKLLDALMVNAELEEFRKEMLISRYFDQYLKDAVTDQSVLNYYNTHAADYETRKVRVAHILIRTHKNMDEATRKAKLTTAQEAYSKILAGEDFAKVAASYSEDTVSSKKGGELGWLAEGAIDKRFSEQVFAMQKDAVSEPFETNFGFHVVKVLDQPTVVKQPFESVKGRILHQLRVEAKDAELKRLVPQASKGD